MKLKQTDLDGNIIYYKGFMDEDKLYEVRNDEDWILLRKQKYNWNIVKDSGL